MRLREVLAEVSTTYQILYLDFIEMNIPLKDQLNRPLFAGV